MFRRPVVVRRRGAPLLGTALVGGAAYAAGRSTQRGATREQSQEQRLSQLEQQGMGMPQQAMPQQTTQTMPSSSQTAPQQMYQPSPQAQPQMSQQPTPSTEVPASQAASMAEASPDKLTQLKTLGELRASGVLTDAEFEVEKQKLLHA